MRRSACSCSFIMVICWACDNSEVGKAYPANTLAGTATKQPAPSCSTANCICRSLDIAAWRVQTDEKVGRRVCQIFLCIRLYLWLSAYATMRGYVKEAPAGHTLLLKWDLWILCCTWKCKGKSAQGLLRPKRRCTQAGAS